MSETPTSVVAEAAQSPRKALLWTSIVAACLAAFGHLMGARIGGFGPSIFWSGLFVGATAYGSYAILNRLSDSRVRSLGPVLAMVAVSVQVTVLALVMFETVSWYQAPAEQDWAPGDVLDKWHRPHRQLGWAPAKNFETDVDFTTGPVHVKLNSMGFRDIEQDVEPGRPRVVIIGDSYPVGWGGTLADSMGPRLREVLPEAQVFNASWTGYSKDQIALSYSVQARSLKPDVVIVMFIVEPGIDDSLPLYRGLRKPWYVLREGSLQMEGLPIEFTTTVAMNKRLYRAWEAERIRGPVEAWHFLTHEFPRRYLSLGKSVFPDYDWVEINRSGFPPLNAVEFAILADLKQQIEADGARMLVGTAPTADVFRHTSDPVAAMRPHLDSYRGIVDPVDITPFLGKDWEQCYNPQSHPNAEGMNRVRGELARRVRDKLRELGKIQ